MIDGWALWLLLVGLALGAAGAWLLLVRVPRQEDDVSPEEQRTEAAWISAIIERDGGIAPESLVEEVLELHQEYLRDPNATPELASPPPAVPDVKDVGDAPSTVGAAAIPTATSVPPPASGAPSSSEMPPPGGAEAGAPPPGGRYGDPPRLPQPASWTGSGPSSPAG